MGRKVTQWPMQKGSVFFDDAASRPTLTKAVKEGRIRRLATNIFTSDMFTVSQELIWRNRWLIVSYFFPNALIVDRSAAEVSASQGATKDSCSDGVCMALDCERSLGR